MEIERKWMVSGWPEGEGFPALPLKEEFAMRQGYISVHPTVRIREEALKGGRTDYILCFKSGGGLAREEIERPIDKALFEDLETKIIAKPLIPKIRRSYLLPDGLVLEQELGQEQRQNGSRRGGIGARPNQSRGKAGLEPDRNRRSAVYNGWIRDWGVRRRTA